MQVIKQERQSKSNDNDEEPKDKYIEKEEIEQQPDGRFRKIKYIYKEENQPNAQTKIESTKIEEKYSTEKHEEVKQIIQEERRESQNQQQINIVSNKEGSQKQSPKLQRSPKLHEDIKENIVKTTNVTQKEVNMQKEGDSQTRIYIKEITYTENKNEGSPEKSNIRYIALKKREDQDVDEEDSQPQDEQPQDEQPLDRREHPQEEKSVEDSKEKQQEPQLQSEIKYNEPKLREEQQLQKEEEKLNQQPEDEQKKSEGKEEIQVQENEIQEQEERNVHEQINVQHEKEDLEVHSHEVEEEHQAGQDHEEQEEQQEEGEEQVEGEEPELEGEEQVEEQMEGQEQEEEAEQENEDEEVPEDGQIERNSMNRPQVSSVEEIKGQNINFQNIQNMNNANINNIQASQGTSNQIQIKAQIVQTQVTKGTDQSKDLRSNIGIRRIQPISSLNNEQSRDPMMYSFGGKSSSATQNLGNSEIKNIDNSDFLVSSIKNNNLATQEGGAALAQNSKIINQSGGYIMSKNVRVVSSSNAVISEGERVTANFGGEINRNTSQSNQVRSSNKFSSSKREPVDGDSKKKQAEEDAKQGEVSEFPLEPRDSRRKI